jgi:hypothetical protein
MSKVDEWPLWLQLLIGIPNAIVMTILFAVWWPKNAKAYKRFQVITWPYLVLLSLFYFFFVR